ncbi:MAG TPA: hypothetical protein VFM60_00755 [Salinimicrobium sp.]|nr:hypothetical protein [Salinimicrobium sp.]
MSTFLKILAALLFIAIITGFYFRMNDQIILGDRIIGISVLVSTFILLPLFLYHSWKGKDVNKYMLSDENMKKMRDKNKKER